jgi:DNA-binding MarR family transcriptional regulator
MYNEQASVYGLTIAEAFILLHMPDDGIQLVHLAAKIGMEPSSFPRILNALEDKTWIERVRINRKDKRAVTIKLTHLGIKAREKAKEYVKSFNNQVFQRVNEADLSAFFRVLDTINQVVLDQKTVSLTFMDNE